MKGSTSGLGKRRKRSQITTQRDGLERFGRLDSPDLMGRTQLVRKERPAFSNKRECLSCCVPAKIEKGGRGRRVGGQERKRFSLTPSIFCSGDLKKDKGRFEFKSAVTTGVSMWPQSA